MNKAYIFNMNGVIIASEDTWRKYLNEIWQELVGMEIAKHFRFPVGMSPESVYAEAVKHGSKAPRDLFISKFNELASKVYTESPITDGINELGEFLLKKNYHLGLVSSSPKAWIETVLKRLSFGDKIKCAISINDQEDLRPKPHPGCYITAIDCLGAKSDYSIALEDSNSVILAAKSAGMFTIGFTAHLLPEYTQHGADVYANNVEDVIRIVEDFERKFEGK